MENTFVDTFNHQVSIKYLYKENLVELGENYYGATRRIKALHNKISDKPEILSEIDKYIQEQIDNGNYIKINVKEARKENQLHFMGYNFVVSVTSSSTKVRMTTDSSMCTKTGLSLNKVTQPAPGNVPSLCGILVHSRCHPHYAVYDINKFFRSVSTSDQDSFLRIVCVPSNSFSCLTFSQPDIYPRLSYRSSTCHPSSCTGGHLHRHGGVSANSASEISVLQDKIGKILCEGGFCIKSWECSGEDGASKYLWMTWDCRKDHSLSPKVPPQSPKEIPWDSLWS